MKVSRVEEVLNNGERCDKYRCKEEKSSSFISYLLPCSFTADKILKLCFTSLFSFIRSCTCFCTAFLYRVVVEEPRAYSRYLGHNARDNHTHKHTHSHTTANLEMPNLPTTQVDRLREENEIPGGMKDEANPPSTDVTPWDYFMHAYYKKKLLVFKLKVKMLSTYKKTHDLDLYVNIYINSEHFCFFPR